MAVAQVAELGLERFGFFSVAFTTTAILRIAADLGLDAYLLREYTRDPSPTLLRRILRAKLLLSALAATLALVLGGMLLGGGEGFLLTAVLAFGMALTNGVGFCASVLIVRQRAVVAACGRLAGGGVALAWAIGFAAQGAPLVWIALFEVWGPAVALAVAAPAVWPSLRRAQNEPANGGLFFRAVLPFGAAGVLVTLHQRLDVLMLKLFRGDSDAGLYFGAALIFYALALIPNAIVAAVFPRFVVQLRDAPEKARELFRRVPFFITLLTLPIAAGGLAVGAELLATLFDNTARPAATALRLLLIAFPLLALGEWLGNAAIALGREHGVVRILAIGLTVNVIGNAAFIPQFGIAAAAGTTLVTEAVVLGLLLLLTRELGSPWSRRMATVGGVALVTFLVARFSGDGFWVPFAAGTVTAVGASLLFGIRRGHFTSASGDKGRHPS